MAIMVVGQRIGHWRDSRRFPPRGHLFSVGSIRLNLNCTGYGKPVVVLDSGMGGSSLDWQLVQPEVAKFTRVCSHDRAGHGWSDSSPAPRTSLQIARELEGLLTSAGERGPYVLVGHSFGGYNVRMFYTLRPRDVAGVVLVDAEHPDEEEHLKEWQNSLPADVKRRVKRVDQQNQLWETVTEPLRLHLGIDRLRVAFGGLYAPGVPKDLQAELLFLEQQPKYIHAVEEENRLDGQSAAQVRAAGDLRNCPLIVLTAGKPYAGDPEDAVLTEEQKTTRDNLWIHQLQAQYVQLSRRSKQTVVDGSSHSMPTDRPDAIVTAIHELWGSAQ